MEPAPPKYEIEALREIHQWKNPPQGWSDKVMSSVNRPLARAGRAVVRKTGLDWALNKTIGALVSELNDLAHWSVRSEAIYRKYRSAGHEVHQAADIFKLDLAQVDEVIGSLKAKYIGLAGVEGAATGLAGLPGIPADVTAMVALAQRAIAEYAAYCGFDVARQEERLFALNVLGLASSPTREERDLALAQLFRIAGDVAGKRAWRNLEKSVFLGVVQKMANRLGLRLTRAKLAQVVPIIGAGAAAGFNAHYIGQVSKAAYFLYRERFLAEKYGPEVLESVPVEALDEKLVDFDGRLGLEEDI